MFLVLVLLRNVFLVLVLGRRAGLVSSLLVVIMLRLVERAIVLLL